MGILFSVDETSYQNLIESVLSEVESNEFVACIDLPTGFLAEDVVETNPRFQCKVCNYNKAIYASLPCGDRWLCSICLAEFEKKQIVACPVCDIRISKIV